MGRGCVQSNVEPMGQACYVCPHPDSSSLKLLWKGLLKGQLSLTHVCMPWVTGRSSTRVWWCLTPPIPAGALSHTEGETWHKECIPPQKPGDGRKWLPHFRGSLWTIFLSTELKAAPLKHLGTCRKANTFSTRNTASQAGVETEFFFLESLMREPGIVHRRSAFNIPPLT